MRRVFRKKQIVSIISVALVFLALLFVLAQRLYATIAYSDYSLREWQTTINDITVKATAPAGAFPEKVKLVATDKYSHDMAYKLAVEHGGIDLNSTILDISFIGVNGEKIQPRTDVSISVTRKDNLGATKYNIAHISGESDMALGNVVTYQNSLEFKTGSFSIYAIIPTQDDTEDKTPRITYNYYVDGNLISTQIVKNGDIIQSPGIPTKDDMYFVGWQLDDGSYFDKFQTAAVVDPNATEDQTINMNGRFSEKIYAVIFHDASGNVTATKLGAPGDVISVNDVFFEVRVGHYIAAWTTNPNDSGEHSSIEDLGDVGESVTIEDDNIDLYPIINGIKWVFFDANDDDADFQTVASYTPAQYVLDGQRITRPADPTREGYTFRGWSRSATTYSAFNFNTAITADTDLYAFWTAKTNTSYNVAIWYETLRDGEFVEGSYGVADFFSLTGTTGASATVAQSRINSVLSQDDYKYYEYDYQDTGKIIAGDGSTMVNVYLKLKVYTVTFNIMRTVNNQYRLDYYTKNGNNYSSTYKTSRTNPIPNQLDGTITVGDDVYSFTDGYSFQARIGESIADVWPRTDNVVFTKDTFTNLTLTPYAWHPVDNNPDNTNLASTQITMTASLIKSNGSAGASYYLISAQDPAEIHVNYWFEDLENGGYAKSELLSETIHNTNGNFTYKRFSGYENVSTPSGYEGNDTTNGVYNYYYNPLSYNLIFYNYNSNDKTESVKYGTSMTDFSYIPPRPTGIPDNYSFAGWFTSPDGVEGSEYDFANEKMPASGLMLYSKWEQRTKVNVIFDSNGGSHVDNQIVSYGGYARTPEKPTREGAVFGGWIKDDGTFFHFGNQITEDTHLVARWLTGETYMLHYDANGGTISEGDDNIYIDAANTTVLPMPESTPSGKYFAGWLLDGKIYYPGSTVVVKSSLADDSNVINIVALWDSERPNTSVSFNANGGTGETQTYDLAENASQVLPSADDLNFSRVGYHFLGWSSEPNAGIIYLPGDQLGVDSLGSLPNVMYARWEINTYTLTVHHIKTDGSEYKPDITATYEHGATYTASPDTSDDTYEYALKAGDSASGTITSNLEVTYIYKKKQGTITTHHVDTDGTTLADDDVQQLDYGTEYNTLCKESLLTLYDCSAPESTSGTVSGNVEVTYTYTHKTGVVTVRHLDSNGTPLVSQETQTVNYGDSYTAHPSSSLTDAYNYTVDSAETVTVMGDVTITYTYTKKTYTLTVHHLKEDNSEYKPDVTTAYEHGATYTASPDTSDVNYEYRLKDGDSASGTITSNLEVTYIYKKKTATITVRHLDTNGNPLADPVTQTKEWGDTYETHPDNSLTAAYSYTVDKPETGTVAGDVTVTYTYTKNAYTLTVHHIKEDNSEYKPDVTTTYEHGATYAASPDTSDNNYEYRLKDGDSASGTITSNLEVTYIYKKKTATITTKHVDNNGTQLADPVTETKEWGDIYTTSPIESLLTAYNYEEPANASDVVSGDVEVTYVYTKKTFTLTVRHLKDDGSTFAETETNTYEYGYEYATHPKNDPNYSVELTSGAADGTLTSNVEVVYTYTRRIATITTRHLDEDGNPLADDETAQVLYGDTYTVYPKAEFDDDYTHTTNLPESGTVSGNLTIVYAYKKIAPPTPSPQTLDNILVAVILGLSASVGGFIVYHLNKRKRS